MFLKHLEWNSIKQRAGYYNYNNQIHDSDFDFEELQSYLEPSLRWIAVCFLGWIVKLLCIEKSLLNSKLRCSAMYILVHQSRLCCSLSHVCSLSFHVLIYSWIIKDSCILYKNKFWNFTVTLTYISLSWFLSCYILLPSYHY